MTTDIDTLIEDVDWHLKYDDRDILEEDLLKILSVLGGVRVILRGNFNGTTQRYILQCALRGQLPDVSVAEGWTTVDL